MKYRDHYHHHQNHAAGEGRCRSTAVTMANITRPCNSEWVVPKMIWPFDAWMTRVTPRTISWVIRQHDIEEPCVPGVDSSSWATCPKRAVHHKTGNSEWVSWLVHWKTSLLVMWMHQCILSIRFKRYLMDCSRYRTSVTVIYGDCWVGNSLIIPNSRHWVSEVDTAFQVWSTGAIRGLQADKWGFQLNILCYHWLKRPFGRSQNRDGSEKWQKC